MVAHSHSPATLLQPPAPQIFGYPSGLGALLVHKEAARHLRKVYFGGGSVDFCTAEDAWAVMSGPPAGLEDGTLGFLNIAALKHGFNMLQQLGGMKVGPRLVPELSWGPSVRVPKCHFGRFRAG